jgi:PAS domain S-box-containing protein
VQPTFSTYAGAVIALLAAVVLRQLLDPWLGESLPFVTLYPAVATVVCLGGYSAPTVVASTGYLLCHFLFQTQRGSLNLAGAKELLGLIEFFFVCSLLVGMRECLRRARRPHQPAPHRPSVLQHEIAGIGITWGRLRDAAEREPLQTERPQLSALVEDSTDFLCLCDPQDVPFYINPAGLSLAGLQRIEEAARMHLCELFLSADRPRVMNEWFPAALERGESDIEVRLRNARDGSARTMAFKMFALVDVSGRIAGFAAIGQDISERRRPDDKRVSCSDGGSGAQEPLPQLRILVVDDNREVAVALARLLRLHGHETFTAHDGAAALEAAFMHRPDVALLDIGMPVLDGYETCRQLRQRPWAREMVVIAVTGWAQEEDRRRSRDAGFDGHLSKPAEYAELAALIGPVRKARSRTRISQRLDDPSSGGD